MALCMSGTVIKKIVWEVSSSIFASRGVRPVGISDIINFQYCWPCKAYTSRHDVLTRCPKRNYVVHKFVDSRTLIRAAPLDKKPQEPIYNLANCFTTHNKRLVYNLYTGPSISKFIQSMEETRCHLCFSCDICHPWVYWRIETLCYWCLSSN